MPLPRAGRSSVMRAIAAGDLVLHRRQRGVIGALAWRSAAATCRAAAAALAVAPAVLPLSCLRDGAGRSGFFVSRSSAPLRATPRAAAAPSTSARRAPGRSCAAAPTRSRCAPRTGSPSANCRPLRAADQAHASARRTRSGRRRARPSLTSPSTNGDSICTKRPKPTHAGDGAVELLADAIAHQDRAVHVDHLALGLHRAPLVPSTTRPPSAAASRASARVRRRAAGGQPVGVQRALEQPVHDQIGIAADRRREVQVVGRRQAEVADVDHVVDRLLAACAAAGS